MTTVTDMVVKLNEAFKWKVNFKDTSLDFSTSLFVYSVVPFHCQF